VASLPSQDSSRLELEVGKFLDTVRAASSRVGL
jgi:hypothetical protein